MKKKNIILVIVLILIELYFFYRNGFVMREMFFFIWFGVFATFFGFKFVGGGSSFGGLGADPKFLAAKASESLYVKPRYSGANYKDLSLDIIFISLALVNLVLTFVAYYLGN